MVSSGNATNVSRFKKFYATILVTNRLINGQELQFHNMQRKLKLIVKLKMFNQGLPWLVNNRSK